MPPRVLPSGPKPCGGNNSLHLGREYARILGLGHYLFLEAVFLSYALGKLFASRNGNNNVHGQASKHIFAPNRGYCLHG